jgi:hypothetical protein
LVIISGIIHELVVMRYSRPSSYAAFFARHREEGETGKPVRKISDTIEFGWMLASSRQS